MSAKEQFLGGEVVWKSTVAHLAYLYSNEWIIEPLRAYSDHTAELVANPTSAFITVIFVLGVALLFVYTILKHIAIGLGLVEPWGLAVLDAQNKDQCIHLFVSLNMIDHEKLTDTSYDELRQVPGKWVYLEFPIVFHMDFEGDEIKDEKMGSDLITLRQRVLQYYLDSQQYWIDAKAYEERTGKEYTKKLGTGDVMIFDQRGDWLDEVYDDDLLVKLGVENGNTVNAVIKL